MPHAADALLQTRAQYGCCFIIMIIRTWEHCCFFGSSCLVGHLNCIEWIILPAGNKRLCSQDIEKIRGEDSWTSKCLIFHVTYFNFIVVLFLLLLSL